MAEKPRVVIVGSGFAGLTAQNRLAKSGFAVTLVDRNVYSTFQPLLYQVATAGLTSADVAYPAWTAAHKTHSEFLRGEVVGVDTATRQVQLADGGVLDFDYLIIATGVSAAFFGVTGAAEHSFSLYTRHDSIILRNRLMEELEKRSAGDDSDLGITIVGGGATGVELAGTLAELRNIALPASFPDVDQKRVCVTLIELGPALLAPFNKKLQEYAKRELVKRGVDVRLGTKIERVESDRVFIAGGAELASDLTVWAAGISGPEWIGKLGLKTGRGGRLLTGPDLRIVDQDRIFAAGDIGIIDGAPLPQLAQPAIQQGRHVADQIRSIEAGHPTKAFSYKDKGIMATIGSRSAVVELPSRIKVRGTLAWLAWLGLHLFFLLGNRNRISALVNLSWRYLTWSRGGGVIIGDADGEEPGQVVRS
ncbi:MAG TPA: NAD(P)/FAD-dependent oxidoreductase [Streptosporangiaceae bacterium]|nr:NAD(P)/FAD-dependent oxidoreductase [Streptosporangiaceae bacterium]